MKERQISHDIASMVTVSFRLKFEARAMFEILTARKI